MAKARRQALAVLRFLNLLEPGKAILSITKIAMWVCIAGLAIHFATGRQLDIAATSTVFATSALYAWRRFVQWKTGTIEQPCDPMDDDVPPASL